MPYESYVNKIKYQVCPYCGLMKPYDWFVKDRSACWSCRGRHLDALEVKARKELKNDLIG